MQTRNIGPLFSHWVESQCMGDNKILIFPFVVLFVLLKNISCICTNKFFIWEKLIVSNSLNTQSCEGKNKRMTNIIN